VIKAEKIQNVLGNLKSYTEKLRWLANTPKEEFLADFTKTESAKHLLQISVECCLDISNHIIASQRFRTPNSYVESFEVLVENNIIPADFLPTLRQMVQFRNRLVHLYWQIDNDVIYAILQENLSDFDRYVSYILDYLSSQDIT